MSLVAWYPLNGSLNNQGISDSILKISGNPAQDELWVENGKIGNCINFNGDLNHVVYENGKDLNAFNYIRNFSFALWLYFSYNTESTQAAQYVFTNGRADDEGYGYGIEVLPRDGPSGRLRIRFGNSSGYVIKCEENEWHHIVTVVSSSHVTIYKDGIEIINESIKESQLPTYDGSKGLGIGCFHYDGGDIYPFYGKVNDFKIYDHCLSQKEINDLSKALVLHYPMNESINKIPWTPAPEDKNNNIVYDVSGFSNDGNMTSISIPSWSDDAMIGCGSYEFDGKSNYVLSNNKVFRGSSFTIATWIKMSDTSEIGTLISCRDAVQCGVSIFYIDNGTYKNWRFDSGTKDTDQWKTGISIDANKWYHVAFVKDYNAKKKYMYLNGELVKSCDSTTEVTTLGTHLSVGASQENGSNLANYFKGNINDLRIYNTALSANEINKIYQTPIQISNNGDLFCKEIIEDESSNLNFCSNGNIKILDNKDVEIENWGENLGLTENSDKVKIYKNRILVNNLYEN